MKSIGHPILVGLPDIAADILSVAGQLRKMEEPADGEAFRQRMGDLFRIFEQRARDTGMNPENVRLGKYALVALVDETILTSKWSLKDSWAGNPLQMEYFDEFAAGEEFYNKLESLQGTEDPEKMDVLEVYYLCLSQGFRGKYGDLKGIERVKGMMEDLSARIARVRGQGDRKLSPSWEREDDIPQLVKGFPAWIVAVACGAILLVVYLVLSGILGAVTRGVIEGPG